MTHTGLRSAWPGKLCWRQPGSAPIWRAQAPSQLRLSWQPHQRLSSTWTVRMGMRLLSSAPGPWVRLLLYLSFLCHPEMCAEK